MKRLLHYGFVLLVVFAFTSLAQAQDRTISGKVTSAEDGNPLPGVNVIVKGTSTGTATGSDGTYKLQVPSNAQALIFSFVGFLNQEVQIGNRSTIDVVLQTDQKLLSEVVVVGYGEQSRKTLTSAITRIEGSTIANLATPSFDQQLAGRAAGVQVTTPSGILGQAPRILIRGTNSVSSGTFPLVVIDNVPMITGNQSGATPTNPIGDINPADIESFEILKDGAATAIFGSRAANGVILITTKRGKRNSGARVNLDAYYGVAQPINRFDLLNAQEFITIANEKLAGLGLAPQAFPDPNGAETDWQSQILRTGTVQNYGINFSGGSDKTTYFFSLGYTDQLGSTVSNAQKRLTFRGNIDHQINKWIEAGTSLSLTRNNNDGLNTGTNALSGNITGGLRLFPNVPVFNPNHPTGYNISPDNQVLGNGANTRNIDNNYTNIRFVLDNNKFQAQTNRILSNSYFQVNILDGLRLKTQYAIDYSATRSFSSLDPRHGDGRGSNGVVNMTQRDVIRWNWQNLLTYNKSLGDHNLGLTAGLEYQKTDVSSFTAGGQNFSDRFFIQNGLITGTYSTQTSSGTNVPTGFDSYFFRANYGYKAKYLAGFSVRNDGISSLPPANRRGNFLGGSLGYRVSEEDFYKNSSLAKIMNEVKLRGSYAEVGNVDIGSFPYVGVFGAAQYASQNGIAFSQAGNPDLKWETSKKIDFGVELGFLNNRLTLSVDYFQNNVDGLILDAPTPSSIGIPGNSISKNIGSLLNKGWEFHATAEVMNKNGFKWNIDANFSAINNQIQGLNKGLDGKDQDLLFTYHVTRVGFPIGSFYGFETAGVNPANGNPLFVKGEGRIVQRNVTTGTYSFYDPANPKNESNTQGAALNFADVADGGDRKILGNSNPTWFGGLTNTFNYKGFELEVFLRYSGGNKILNLTRQGTLLNYDFNNSGREILNRWQKEGDVTDVPRLVINRTAQANLTGATTTRFLEKGDFLRIQNIVLSYNLPSSLLDKGAFPVRSLRVFVQVQNAFTFTKYTGLDPELSSSTGNSTFGTDENTNPQIRFTTFGINIGL
ncbi:SusC/RagA family TonB-linked outer membrane protein [Thermoflexibacter ruber]|uniref:TonB-linked outer membrane protein, SusC/RagA family n=1 Tax=Thermoflexibacter ruber TaxID=1003 RepID=A0A1I2FDX1_9BACT|nr:TonB-dependent receptor [Thermoflexibacter ruber]SFF03193.1 TonB-linked outer membrane protein, SusC/RagA family [Thermoflexibacter ruber]